ncbi:CocE/NonD family hydrolase [Streptomyces sp. NPDC020719]|uniref:CocE/NonD family hydrolase n=1 Tax=Streptomyces sp. NPDC020719 TaxID=3154896 RepID=UPI003411E7EB
MTSEQHVSLYPELDEASLTQFAAALRSGDTAHLSPARAGEVTRALSVLTFAQVQVPGEGGVKLAGALWRHTGNRARPAIVMPAPWTDFGWLVYAVQATRFALKGYHVLAYTPRGFGLAQFGGASGGEVEVAGPLDVADGRAALTYLIDQVKGPVTKTGFLGDSYGSGISQLVAAHDPRVDAVAALSTWGDLGEAFYENSTRHVESVRLLRQAAQRARLSARTEQAFDDVLADQNVEETLEWARERSPYTYVDLLNGRPVAVFYANAWHETLFPANQALRTFTALTGPRRIDLSIGDHSGPEMSGMIGLPNRIWADAHRWFDHHLKGEPNGIATEGRVLGQIMWNEELELRDDWDAVTETTDRLYLTRTAVNGDGRGRHERDGGLAEKPETGWTSEFRVGTDTPATVADKILETGNQEMAGNPKVYPTHDIDRADAAVWVTGGYPSGARLRGIPRLHLTYTSTHASSTFVAHLFDVGPDGSAHIVTHAPFTRLDHSPGRPVSVDVEFQATGYDIPADHRLMLVLDTVDPFYGDANAPGGTITVTSPADDPSHLDLPLG